MTPPDVSRIAARAGHVIGTVLESRSVRLGVDRWPLLAAHLHPAATDLLDFHWFAEAPDDYHLSFKALKSIARSDTAKWLIQHGFLLVGKGPDGTFVTVSNDDRLEATYVSMQESAYMMEEGGPPPPGTTRPLGFDIFRLLEHLKWMSDQCVDGYFPDHLDRPIPLDFYEEMGDEEN